MRRSAPVSVLPLLALAAALHLPAAAQQPDVAAPLSLRPGDVVRVTAWRLPEFTGEYAVAPDGTILHPLLSEVRVVGVTREEILSSLRAVLRRYETDPRVVVDFLYRVSVIGEVSHPNLYPLPAETTIPQALAAAGGATTRGHLGRVLLLRDGRETVLDLRSPDPELAEMRIRSGDRLRVPRRTNVYQDVLGPAVTVVSAVASVITLLRVL